MLDSHPRLAIPPESHFIVRLAYRRLRLMHRPELALERILAHTRFRAWDLDPDDARAFVTRARAASYPDVVRAVFDAYASAYGKPRWGDKTPGYVHFLPELAQLFPDAQFIHVVRDGREVAVSVSERDWWPGSPVSAAFWWRRYVRVGREAGTRLGPDRYLELRLERLIADPQAELGSVCAFLGESYDPAMLAYPTRSRGRMGLSSAEPLPPHLSHIAEPPTARLRSWSDGLPSSVAAQVEAACWPMLQQLGYDTRRPAVALRLAARSRWLADLPPRVRLFLSDQRHPQRADT